ncbi:5323_t:CDS:1, partial [Funneliformis geosporum]
QSSQIERKKIYDAPIDNTTNQHVNPDTFIRQLQSYMGLYPFVDALSKSAGWPTTAAEQPILLSQLGCIVSDQFSTFR